MRAETVFLWGGHPARPVNSQARRLPHEKIDLHN
jgi:hypothetical protein